MTSYDPHIHHHSDIAHDADYHIINGDLNELNRKEAALAAYEEAIQFSPYEPRFYQRKGQVLEQLGRLAEAQRAYEEAYRLSQKS